jgi:hypothetical protein
MKLPDFLQFEAFNKLRATMGAEDLGDFVFFDPKKNLTGIERLELKGQGLIVSAAILGSASDFTLTYKDSRVAIYLNEPESMDDWLYHVSDCEMVHAARASDKLTLFSAKTVVPVHATGTYKVCSSCLQKLRYQNFDGVRQRHREYSQRIEDVFSLTEFFQEYPMYPVVIKKEIPIF